MKHFEKDIVKLNKLIEENSEKFTSIIAGNKIIKNEKEKNIYEVIKDVTLAKGDIWDTPNNKEGNSFITVVEDKIYELHGPQAFWETLEGVIKDANVNIMKIENQRADYTDIFRSKIKELVKTSYEKHSTIRRYLDLINQRSLLYTRETKIELIDLEEKLNTITRIIIAVLTEEINHKENDQNGKIKQLRAIEAIGKSFVIGLMINYLPNELNHNQLDEVKAFLKTAIPIYMSGEDADETIKMNNFTEFFKKYCDKNTNFRAKSSHVREMQLIILAKLCAIIAKIEANDYFLQYSEELGELLIDKPYSSQNIKIYYRTKLKPKLKKEILEYGKLLFENFYDNIFCVKSEVKKGPENEIKTENFLELIDKQLIITKSPRFPKFHTGKSTNEKLKRQINDLIYEFDYGGSLIHEAYYLTTKLARKELLNFHTNKTPFQLNYNSCYDFISDLIDIQNAKNNLIIAVKENIHTTYKFNEIILLKLGEIYEINFLKILQKHRGNNFEILKKLLDYAVDFNNLKKIDQIKDYIHDKLIYKLVNKIYSTKIDIHEKLLNITVTRHFSKHFHEKFVDSRGRIYVCHSALSYQASRTARTLISFSGSRSLLELNKGDSATCLAKIETIKQCFYNQLNSLLKVNKTFDELLSNDAEKFLSSGFIKEFEFFNFRACLKDFKDFIKEPLNHKFRTNFSLDSSNSGLQMQSLLFRNEKMAKYCRLTLPSIDFYSQFIVALKQFHIEMKNICMKIPQEFWNKFFEIKNDYSLYTLEILDELPGATKTKVSQIFYEKYENLDVNLLTPECIIKIQEFANKYLNKKFDAPKKTKTGDFSTLSVKSIKILDVIFQFSSLIHDDSWLEEFSFDRSLAKKSIMSLPYGVTLIGIKGQLYEFMFEKALKTGILFTDQQIRAFVQYSNIISGYFMNWARNELPESFLLLDSVTKACNNNTIKEPIKFTNQFVETQYLRVVKNTIQLPVGRRATNEKRFNPLTVSILLEGLDKNKIKNSTAANFCHFADSYIMWNYIQRCTNLDYLCFGVHDRFYIEYGYADKLLPLVKELYIDLMNQDLLSKSFPELTVQPNIYGNLTASDLNNDEFIRH